MSAAMSSLSGGKLMPASSSTSNSSSPLISLTLAAYSAGSLLLEEGGDHDDQGIGNLNLTYGVVPFSSSSLSSTAVQHLLPSQQVNASTNALIESITASPSTDNSTAAAGPANIFTTLKIVKISLLAVIFVLILCGNVFVLLALNNRKLKINRMYFFLVHLSIADLITGIFNVLPQLAWEAVGRFYGGNALCKMVKFLQILGPYLSSYVLVMTAIDRYQAICHPLSNSSSQSTSRSRWMVFGAWLISLISCSPQPFIFSYQQIGVNHYECWATFPYPWMPGAYVTFYTFTVFIVPFFILTYTHVIICREIWLNWHSKRQSLMVKDHHSTKPKPPSLGVEGKQEATTYQLVANSTSISSGVCTGTAGVLNHSSSSGLARGLAHPHHHPLPHSPLPTSKGSSRHSLAASSHFFAKGNVTTTTATMNAAASNHNNCSKQQLEPLETTTTLNRHVSSKCSRTINRLLWICNKSSSVSSNSSAVSTSTNSSASSTTHRASFPGPNSQGHPGHQHQKHQHQQHQQQQHHHRSTPSLALTGTALLSSCPLHDKLSNNKLTSALIGDGEEQEQGRSTATDIPARSNGYGPVGINAAASATVNCTAVPQGFDSLAAKEVPLEEEGEAKVLSSEHAPTTTTEDQNCQLMRHAKSESELWFERQRKQIRRKRRKLQLLDSVDAGHYCAYWSSSSSSSTSSSSSSSSSSASSLADSPEPNSHSVFIEKGDNEAAAVKREKKVESNRNRDNSHYNRQQSKQHRRNTLTTVTSNMLLLRACAAARRQQSDELLSSNADNQNSSLVLRHQGTCPCARCVQICRCAAALDHHHHRHHSKVSTGLRPVWKVLNKPATPAAAANSELSKNDESEIEKASLPPLLHSGSSAAVRVNTSADNATTIEVVRRSSDSLPKLLLHCNAPAEKEASRPVQDYSPPLYSPVYEDHHFREEKDNQPTGEGHYSMRGARGSDSVSETHLPKSTYQVNKLTHSTSSTGSTNAGSVNVLVPRNYQINRNRQTRLSNPRIHSMQGLTRAKIKTVKITLVVITCYVICSSPFIGVQLWAQFWPGAQETAFWRGPMIAILMLLPSLNSCVNPWIYIYFNPNLVSSFCSLFTRRTSSNSNLHSIGGGAGGAGGGHGGAGGGAGTGAAGGKNSNGSGTTAGGKGGKEGGGNGGGGHGRASSGAATIHGHRTLTKMLTNDSGECSNSVDSRSMRDNNSRLDLLSAARETQQFGSSGGGGGGSGGHARSASASFRPGSHQQQQQQQHQQMKSCGTGADISVECDNNSNVTTSTTITTNNNCNNTANKLQPVTSTSSAVNQANANNPQQKEQQHSSPPYGSTANHNHTPHPNNHPHHHSAHHYSSNMSSMSNLNEESATDTVATFESTVTLSTNSTVTTAGGGGASGTLLRHHHTAHPQGRPLSCKSKSNGVVSHSGSTSMKGGGGRKPRRRISIQLDKMWSKFSAPNKRASLTNSSQIGLYHSKHSAEQFIV